MAHAGKTDIENCFRSELSELLATTQLKTSRNFIQHGNTSVLLHSAAVAFYSYKLARGLRLTHVRRRELVRGALLHDYFLYDWHTHKNENGLHGFCHPTTALENARRDTCVSPAEAEIIIKHMFPLTLSPPKTKAAWIICLVDKACSVYETFARRPYGGLRDYLAKSMAAEAV